MIMLIMLMTNTTPDDNADNDNADNADDEQYTRFRSPDHCSTRQLNDVPPCNAIIPFRTYTKFKTKILVGLSLLL